MRRALLLLLALALVAAACGDDDEGAPTTTTSQPATTPVATTAPPVTGAPTTAVPPTTQLPGPGVTGELARADVPHATSTDVTEAEIEALVAGNTSFALDVLRRVAGSGENSILSPFSIAAALTMTYAGAREGTATEMRDVLHLGLPDDSVHEARNELELRIADVPEPSPNDDREPLQVNVANSLWGQRGFAFEQEFLEILASAYDAGVRLTDFVADPEAARGNINDWVEDETNDRIMDLLPPGSVTTDTRLVLANAIWFKANWANPFEPSMTAPGPFLLFDGTEVTVPLMHANQRMRFTRGEGYKAASLGYAGDASMLVIAPGEGRFEEIVAGLDPGFLASIDESLSTHQVDLTMPKFEFESQLGLRSILSALGMNEAFSPAAADFSGISTQRDDLHVQDVLHKAFIAVDEEGTEAAAATAVVVGVTSAPPPATLTLDNPFIFLIRHDSTGEILFAGTVTNPA